MNETLSPGTHLTTPRLGYRHHGLYAGQGRVLHYRGMHRWLLQRGPVEEVSLAQFARGRGFAVVASTAARFDGESAVERARSRLGENRWRLWSNNCEHFVTWCLDGTPRSAQVESWRARLQAARAALFGAGTGAPKTVLGRADRFVTPAPVLRAAR
jgi:Lecithin retinol acyltransferase